MWKACPSEVLHSSLKDSDEEEGGPGEAPLQVGPFPRRVCADSLHPGRHRPRREHTIEVHKPGYKPWKREVTVMEDAAGRIRAELEDEKDRLAPALQTSRQEAGRPGRGPGRRGGTRPGCERCPRRLGRRRRCR